MKHRCGQYLVTNCWCDVGLSVRCFLLQSSKIDGQLSKTDDRCADLQRWMIDVSTFEDRCVHLRRSMMDVPTFEDRWSMCRPSKVDDPCEIMLLHLLKILIL